jgi:hypothetical protein
MRFSGIPYIGQLLIRISFPYILITKLLPPGLFIYPDDHHEHFPLEFRNTSTKQPGKRSRYSDALRAGQSGFPFPVGDKDFPYPDWPWGPSVCSNWYQGPHRGVMLSRSAVDHPPPFLAASLGQSRVTPVPPAPTPVSSWQIIG